MYDSEGELGSPTSSDDERNLQPLEENVFGGTPLEVLLKPLTALEELADHPSLGEAYRDTALTTLAAEAAKMLREERENLWKAKRLLRRFEGDTDWAPCATFETGGDQALLDEQQDAANGADQEGTEMVLSIMDNEEPGTIQATAAEAEPLTANGVKAEDMAQENGVNDIENTNENKEAPQDMVDEARMSVEPQSETASTAASNLHAMTTRARARSPQQSNSPSLSPSDSASVPAIHPWFMTPATSLPDRDLGLPPDEAETTRKMLLLYCQKQEQIIQSLNTLYSGLQRGDRLRKFVLASTKAAGHLVLDGKNGLVTEMSDGEDWFDVAEFGRLEKGKDEVEDIEEEGRRGGRRRRVVGRV